MNKKPFSMRIILFVAIALFVVISGCGVEKIDSPPPVLVSIDVSPTDSQFAPGTAVQLKATGTFLNCCQRDITKAAVWTSSHPEIITISDTGLAIAVEVGSATITATSGSISGKTTLTSAMPESISVSPGDPSIALKTTIQFAAFATFSDSSKQNLTPWVTWDSSDPEVATITETGLATSVSIGTAVIRATFMTVSGSTTLKSALPESISLSPVDSSIALGTKQQFTATGIFADGSTQDLTETVAWSSSDLNVATISDTAGSKGLASSEGDGVTTITADFEGISGSTSLTVTADTPVSIEVTPTDPNIALGKDQQFTATGTFSDGTTQDVTLSATWTSLNEGIATVSNAAGSEGLATSVAEGSTEITATFEGRTGSTTLSVTSPVLISISVTPVNPTIALGASQQFTATGTFSDGSTGNLTTSVLWSSSDPDVATISNEGLASALFITGVTTITASAIDEGISGSTSLTVAIF